MNRNLLVVMLCLAGASSASAQTAYQQLRAAPAVGAERWADGSLAAAMPVVVPEFSPVVAPPALPAMKGAPGAGYVMREEGFAYGWRLVETPARWMMSTGWMSVFGLLLGLALAPFALLAGLFTSLAGEEGDVTKWS